MGSPIKKHEQEEGNKDKKANLRTSKNTPDVVVVIIEQKSRKTQQQNQTQLVVFLVENQKEKRRATHIPKQTVHRTHLCGINEQSKADQVNQ